MCRFTQVDGSLNFSTTEQLISCLFCVQHQENYTRRRHTVDPTINLIRISNAIPSQHSKIQSRLTKCKVRVALNKSQFRCYEFYLVVSKYSQILVLPVYQFTIVFLSSYCVRSTPFVQFSLYSASERKLPKSKFLFSFFDCSVTKCIHISVLIYFMFRHNTSCEGYGMKSKHKQKATHLSALPLPLQTCTALYKIVDSMTN